MKPITICFTHFKTLTAANFEAALYSVRRQDLSQVEEIAIVDNDSETPEGEIYAIIDELSFPIPVFLQFCKHGDLSRAQAWSTNVTVRKTHTPWTFYTRSDYLLSFDMLSKFVAVVNQRSENWDGFVVSNGCHLGMTIGQCEASTWRESGPTIFQGVNYDYTEIDSGVWMARRATYDRIGGFDERLSAWGHAQTEFQYRMFKAGVEFVRIPEVLFFHPQHGGARDISVAHQQLKNAGLEDIRKMWERYPGPKFY